MNGMPQSQSVVLCLLILYWAGGEVKSNFTLLNSDYTNHNSLRMLRKKRYFTHICIVRDSQEEKRAPGTVYCICSQVSRRLLCRCDPMKAPPSPTSARRVGIVQAPPLDQIDGAPQEPPSSQSPKETTNTSGDSRGPVLLNNTHHNNLVNEHLDLEVKEGHNNPILVSSEENDPKLVNSQQENPKLVNGQQEDPKLVNGQQQDPILVNGEQKLVNGGHESPTMKLAVPETEKLWTENRENNLTVGRSHNELNNDYNKSGDGPDRIGVSKLNELNRISSSLSDINNLQDGLSAAGSSEVRAVSPKPFPAMLKRKVSRDCLFYFPVSMSVSVFSLYLPFHPLLCHCTL